jgi:hypothetical protein
MGSGQISITYNVRIMQQSIAVDNRVRDTNNNIAIFFKDFEPFSTNRKFDGSRCLEQSIKNFSILDSDLALFCPYISFKTFLLKTDWNTKFKYIKYNYDKDGLRYIDFYKQFLEIKIRVTRLQDFLTS